jgi:seryl-tRNA synthetase
MDANEATAERVLASEFREELLAAGVLWATSVAGLYHRSAQFESVLSGVAGLASSAGRGECEPMRYFPPVMPRDTFVRTDYLRSFPQLVGSVATFTGGDGEHARLLAIAEEGGDWTRELSPAEVTLCSAACHSLYPSLTGMVPEGGRRFEVQGYCFRHEPSIDPGRMQSFRMHEFVFVGEPAGAREHRDRWLERGLSVLGGLGLPVEAVVANDPFFGRAGRILAANQKDVALKYEIVCPVASDTEPTAISSANYHLDHFGVPFEITTTDGPAHSSCFGFGLERITLALFRHHGLDPTAWSASVHNQLALP